MFNAGLKAKKKNLDLLQPRSKFFNRTGISSKLGLSRDLPYSFYEEYIANSVLPDHLVRSIAKMIEREPKYTLIHVIFNAFKLALTKTKEELNRIKSNNLFIKGLDTEIS